MIPHRYKYFSEKHMARVRGGPMENKKQPTLADIRAVHEAWEKERLAEKQDPHKKMIKSVQSEPKFKQASLPLKEKYWFGFLVLERCMKELSIWFLIVVIYQTNVGLCIIFHLTISMFYTSGWWSTRVRRPRHTRTKSKVVKSSTDADKLVFGNSISYHIHLRSVASIPVLQFRHSSKSRSTTTHWVNECVIAFVK